MKILILSTGNSCRSQMAHGNLMSLDTKGGNAWCAASPINSVLNKSEPTCGCSCSNSNCC